MSDDAEPSRPRVSRVSRYTFRYHLLSSVFEGGCNGVFAINDVVARKTFGAGPLLMVLLTMAPSVAQLLALVLAPKMARSDQRRLFLVAGVLGRLSLVAVAAVQDAWGFLAFVVLNSIVQSAVIPAQNAVFQANYAKEFRGRLFGWATALMSALTVVTAYGAGFILDRDPAAYRFIYPAAGVAGFVALMIFGQIRLRRFGNGSVPPDPAQELAQEARALGAWALARRLRAQDRAFLWFEGAFMLYGLGFMSIQPCLAPFLVDVMRMDYLQASAAKGSIFYLFFVALMPLAGMFHDRVGIERLGAASCVGLAIFTTSLTLVGSKQAVYGAFALYGAAMAGIHVAWTMGPIKYAGARDASAYMGLHVALVGVRGLVGHPLGGIVSVLAGTPRATFAMAAVLFLGAAVWMARLSAPGGVAVEAEAA